MEKYFFETILNQENNSIRFEHFCCDIYSSINNIEVVPTSKSYDLGRDGRQIGVTVSPKVYLSATLNKKIDSKVSADLKRLKETTSLKSLVYCSSISLSEHAVQEIEKEIKNY